MKKKKSKPAKHALSSKRGPFFAPHPFNSIPFEGRRDLAIDNSRKALINFNELLPKIETLVTEHDPLHTVGLLSTYGLMGTPTQQAENKRLSWTPKLQQGHVEYLQALALRNAFTKSGDYPEPDIIQQFFDGLPELFQAHQMMQTARKLDKSQDGKTLVTPGLGDIQDFLRAHTAVVRNWGYFGNVIRISAALLSRMDSHYEPVAGMKLSKIVEVFAGLVRRHEDIVNEHWGRLRKALNAGTNEKILDAFFAAYPFRGEIDEFRANLAGPSVTRQHLMSVLWPVADRILSPQFLLTSQELAERFDISPAAASSLAKAISLPFESLAEKAPESLFLDNPVWLRPLIHLEGDHYFCALPQTLLSFVNQIAEQLLVPHKGLSEKFSDVKAKYLEDEVERLLSESLPSLQQHRGFKWREGDQEFENDLAIRFDSTIILIEAKSGKISWPALRGAPARMVEHIKKLIVEPSDQSGRLAQRIEEDINRVKAGQAPQLNFPLALEGVTCVARISVMLHDFATIQSIPGMLLDANLISTQYPLAPCIMLADLKVMLHLLERSYLRLHYLRRRSELNLKLNTFGDELDMLGMYLDTGFNLGTMNAGHKTILNMGYSTKLDRYYTLRDEGIASKKPKPKTSEWFTHLCEQLQKRSRPGWSEIACALLSIAHSDEVKMDNHIRFLAKRLKDGKTMKNGQDTMILIPPENVDIALAFQVKRSDQDGPYGAHLANIASQAFDSGHVKRCVVIVVDALDKRLSYLSAGLFLEENTSQTIYY